MVTIRPETDGDRDAVFEVNRLAFETDAEARLVDGLRPAASPLLSLVADAGGEVVGHILFSPVEVGESRFMGLGPMAVRPEHQNRGIGSQLVLEGLRRLRGTDAGAVVVLGHAEYYPRFGFEPAGPRGLHFESEEYDPYFFVLELIPGALDGVSGFVRYHPLFSGV